MSACSTCASSCTGTAWSRMRSLRHRKPSNGGLRAAGGPGNPTAQSHPSPLQQRRKRARYTLPRAQSLASEVLEGKCMEEVYQQVANHALKQVSSLPSGTRYMVGVAGVPGSGKSTLVREVCRRVNKLAGSEVAVVVPMDGFHFYRRELDAMPDPAAAHARRGAPWTFDAEAYVACIRQAKQQGTMSAPSFDHGVGDPVADAIQVTTAHRVVLSEGNYLLLDEAPWDELRSLFDLTLFVDCNIDAAMRRVFARQTGHGVTEEVSRKRISGNDRPNAELVQLTRNRASLIAPALPLCARAST